MPSTTFLSRFLPLSLFTVLLLWSIKSVYCSSSEVYPAYYVLFKNEHVAIGDCAVPTQAVITFLYVAYVTELVTKTDLTDDDVVAIDPLLLLDPLYLLTRQHGRNLRQGVTTSESLTSNEVKQNRLLQSQCGTFCSNPSYYAVQIRLRGCDCNRRHRYLDENNSSHLLYQTGNASYIAPGPASIVATKYYNYVSNYVTTANDCRSKMYNATYEVWTYN